jgi:hypothetical protein
MSPRLPVVVAMLLLTGVLAADVCAGSVRGYYRKDGTYVQPHQRTNPDGDRSNNYSSPGNYNPNTGKITPGDPHNAHQESGPYGPRAPSSVPADPASPISMSPSLPQLIGGIVLVIMGLGVIIEIVRRVARRIIGGVVGVIRRPRPGCGLPMTPSEGREV